MNSFAEIYWHVCVYDVMKALKFAPVGVGKVPQGIQKSASHVQRTASISLQVFSLLHSGWLRLHVTHNLLKQDLVLSSDLTRRMGHYLSCKLKLGSSPLEIK